MGNSPSSRAAAAAPPAPTRARPCHSRCAEPAGADRPGQPVQPAAGGGVDIDLMKKIAGLQQRLAEVSASPLLGLQDAADSLAEQLQADLVSVWVLPRGEPLASVLMAATGRGVAALQRDVVVRHQPQGGGAGGGWQQRIGAPCFMQVPDTACPEAPRVEPADLWHGPETLRSFVQAPIGPPSAPLGVLLLASAEPGAFQGADWRVQVQMAAAGLLPHVWHAQVERLAQLLLRLDGLEDPVAMIGALLRGASDFMLRSCTLATSPRIALLQPSGAADDAGAGTGPAAAAAALRATALLFEAPRAAAGALLSGSSGRISTFSNCRAYAGSADSAAPDPEEVVASRLKLRNTLLGAAIAQQQARFVADVGKYMQSCPRPARDVFTRSSRLVSSIVVIPLVAGHKPPLGGLYFALDAPCKFTHIQDTLLGFTAGATPLLYNKLAGKAAGLARAMREAQQAAPAAADGSSCPIQLLPGGGEPGVLLLSDVTNLGTSNFSSSSGSEGHQQGACPQPAATPSGRLPTISSSDRVNTEAMLTLLQQHMQAKQWRRHRDGAGAAEVVVGELLGQDGRCPIFKGTWHRVPVAVKVMPARSCEREAMQDAVEMAVLSSVQHPNIVTVYACLTDMVETADSAGSRSASASTSRGLDLRTYFRRLAPEEDHDDVEARNMIVMEPCDRGSLRDALARGLLHQKLPGGALGVRYPQLLEVLTNVAHALQRLHAMQLVHSDVRLDSVLLKADRTRPLGVNPKLAGFGRARILHGCELSAAADVAAFGLLMYEAYTADKAFKGAAPGQAEAGARDQEVRPKFPESTPPAFAQLARACWAADPASRPSAGQVARRLGKMAAAKLSLRAA